MSSIINYPPLESYFNGATFTGEVSLNSNVAIVSFGTVFNNNRYVIDNPFGNENYEGCIVRAECYYNGGWTTVEQIGNYGSGDVSAGFKGHSTMHGLVIQTGITHVIFTRSVHSLDSLGLDTSVSVDSAPARVIVTYIGATNA